LEVYVLCVSLASIHRQTVHNLSRVLPNALPPDSVPIEPRLGRATSHPLDPLA